jgi:hypothetical protein
MSATTFKPGVYYRHVCPFDHSTLYKVSDVEDYSVCVPLGNNEIVLCTEIVHRSGGQGRGLYAKLLSHRGFAPLPGREPVAVVATIYHRVSKNHIGSGNWEEVNAMMVLALADQIPTI